MSNSAPLFVRFGEYELDEGNARLRRAQQAIDLTPRAFAVLCALARQPGQLMLKDALLDAVWGHRHVSESVLKTTISQLRQVLDDDPKEPRFIETVARRGYRFAVPTSPASFEAMAVTSAPAAAWSHTALPDHVETGPAPLLVGRSTALTELKAAWARAQQGQRQIVWVTGEAGVGKSSLIDSLADQFGEVAVAYGQCVEPYGAGEPYLPVLDAIGALSRRDLRLPGMLRTIAPTWLMQMPWLVDDDAVREALLREVSGASQDRMLREMGELLDRYTQDRPLLLITEDLHWSDHATVRLIDHLARRRTPGRLMWLGSFRPAELLATDHPLKGVRQELRARRACQELPLEPFSERDLADYLARRLPGAEASDDFVRRLHLHTDGLPLFVANVVDDWLAQGAVSGKGVRLDLSLLADQHAVPDSLAGVIERQLERLPAEDQAMLEAASVCGMDFRADTVAETVGVARDEVGERCDRLSRQQTWLSAQALQRRPDGSLDAPFAFRHALYRQVIYQRLGTARRAALHLRVMRSLTGWRASGGQVAASELAMHAERGHDLLAAVGFLAEAAGSAMAHFAPLEAARHAEHGLALLPQLPGDQARLELELSLVASLGVAQTQLLGVAAPEAVAALQRARDICETLPANAERTWVLNGIGWVYYTRGEFDQARGLARRVEEQATVDGDPVLHVCACNLMGVTLCNSGHQQEARRWLEDGVEACLAMAGRLPRTRFVVDPEVAMRANLIQPLTQMGLHDLARAQCEASMARARDLGQPMALMLALWCNCMFAVRVGDVDLASRLASALDDVVARHDVAQGQGPSRWYRGWAMARQGQPDMGHRLILEGYDSHARLGMFAGCAKVLGYAAEARALSGRLDDALDHLDEALALARRIDETLDLPYLLAEKARVLAARGDAEASRDHWQQALDAARHHGATGYEVEALTALCAGIGATPADRAALQNVIERLDPGFDARLRERAQARLTGT